MANMRHLLCTSFPKASIFFLEKEDLEGPGLSDCDMIVLPASGFGEDTPYKFFMSEGVSQNLSAYARKGRLLTVCSGTYAIINSHRFHFSSGDQKQYNGYVPLLDVPAYGPLEHGGKQRGNGLRLVPVFRDAGCKEKDIPLCYDGGPVMMVDGNSNEHTRVLAFFAENKASVLAHKIDDGIVVACSSLVDIRSEHLGTDGPYADIRRALQENATAQLSLWRDAMTILETRTLHPA